MDWDEARELVRRVSKLAEDDFKTNVEVATQLTKAIVNIIAKRPTL